MPIEYVHVLFNFERADPKPKLALARRMRRAPTFHEDLLWKLLRNRRLERLKFRRQVPIGRYVADFLCLRHRLIIEADGPFHDPGQDAIRDAWLKSQGFHVLRFPNSTVSNRPNELVTAILKAVETPTTCDFDAPVDRWTLDTGAPLPPAYLQVEPPERG
ncbi:MAG: hypothetical protein JWR84_3846 [Caulobacter sp.]|nr:hypothetical protein [Caulobacter sp.]